MLTLILLLAASAMAQSSSAISSEMEPSTTLASMAPSALPAASDPNAPVSTSAPPDPGVQIPFNTGPQSQFHFLSPALVYSPPGAWFTNMLTASPNTSAPVSVSLSTVASGITWQFANTNVSLLVNGSDPSSLNATTTISDRQATISGLEYGWYNFTLVTNGTGSFSGATPLVNGSEWLPAQRGPMVAVNSTGHELYATSGNWTGDFQLSTNETGASLTIRPPLGTALLEVTQDVPSLPSADYNVTVSPPPPHQPSNQSFTGTLHETDIVFTIGILNVLLYRVELDPKVNYTVEIQYTGDGTWSLRVNNIGAYRAREANVTNMTAENSTAAANPSAAGATASGAARVNWGVPGFLAVVLLIGSLWVQFA